MFMPSNSNSNATICLLTIAIWAHVPDVAMCQEVTSGALALQILEPVYRHNLYATQQTPVIAFRVTLDPATREQTSLVRARLLDAAQKTVHIQEVSPTDASEMRFQAASLAAGNYTLQVQALAANQSILAVCESTIHKLPPAPGSEVRVDQYGNLVVNGQGQVMIGWYGNVPTDDPRQDVIALQNIETPAVINYPNTQPLAERFSKHGIYTIVSCEPGRLMYSFDLWKQPNHPVPTEHTRLDTPSPECRELLRKLVEVLQREPGLFGYYIADEPEINNTRPEYLANLYRLLCELDPYHPVIITNDTIAGIITHGKDACDILTPDPYGAQWDYVPSFLRKVREVARPGQTAMLCPWQSSHQIHFVHDIGTYPPYTYRLMRHQYLSAVTLGCRGFTGYTNEFFLPEPELRYGLPPIWREVGFLAHAINAPPPAQAPTVKSDQPILSWLREADGYVYLILANDRAGQREVRLAHASLEPLATLQVEGEARDLPVSHGAISLTLPEGTALVLTSDPRTRELATCQEVEQQITDQQQAAQRPGNLLHWSRGVRARASAGYTPWFDQIFYYAINGIRDDNGWYLSHAEPPGWLELVLPQPQSIGRVLLATPNLRDYDLRFMGPDGTMRCAEIRGNQQEMAEHHFDPPVNTLKLRLVAIATRPEAQPTRPMVREIEAYADGGSGSSVPVRLLAPAGTPPNIPFDTTKQVIFWKEDFHDFRHGDKFNYDGRDDFWVYNPESLFTEKLDGGGLLCRNLASVGYTSMQRFLDYDPAARFLQLDIRELSGDGYRFGSASLSDGSGTPGFRPAHSANKAGLFTIDVHAISPQLANGSLRRASLSINCVGPSKAVTYKFHEFRLVQLPQDGVSVTLADGSPLPDTLRAGDELLFYVRLSDPALDVTVDVQGGPNDTPVAVNGESSVQLLRTGDSDGRQWAAAVKLGAGTDRFELAGYPILFRAIITGGRLSETFAPAFVSIDPSGGSK